MAALSVDLAILPDVLGWVDSGLVGGFPSVIVISAKLRSYTYCELGVMFGIAPQIIRMMP